MSTKKRPSLPLLIVGIVVTTLGLSAVLSELAELSLAQTTTLFCLTLGFLSLGVILKYKRETTSEMVH